jgi:hypothetical protein
MGTHGQDAKHQNPTDVKSFEIRRGREVDCDTGGEKVMMHRIASGNV